MNRKIILSVAFIATLFVTSCKKELQPQESSETPVTETVATPEGAPVEATQPQVQAAASAPMQTVQAPTPTTTKTAPGMNPPHGQPNHRCDIAVGAPLNSPKGQAPATQTVTKPSTVEKVNPQSGQPQPVVQTAPGMNPPHGQPGHRCEIAVGAPLPTE